MRTLRLFNDPAGLEFLQAEGIDSDLSKQLELLGISSIGNLLAAIKQAKYYELTEDDVIFTCFTDSAGMYLSRLEELNADRGPYTRIQAARDYEACILAQSYDNYLELSYRDRKRIHNLKYYTWVEQQGKSYEDILAQWDPAYWSETFEENVAEIDAAITAFNAMS